MRKNFVLRLAVASFAYVALLASFASLTGCGAYQKKSQPLYGQTVNGNQPAISQPGLDGLPVIATQPVRLSLTSPVEGQVTVGSDVTVSFMLENYVLAEKGNHVHLILDNEPYVPWYDVTKPYVFKNVTSGPHVIRAFPSRPWHESWKNAEAFSVVRFFVKEQAGTHGLDLTQPYLTYSRPKGEYAGENAKKVMLDFWVSNCQLSEGGYKVRYTLDGQPAFATTWAPVWWDNLSPGMHTVVLELLDAENRPVKNGWSRTERTFTIKAAEGFPAPHH